MATFEFLTPEWITAAREARDRHSTGDLMVTMAMNLVVTSVPFGSGTLEAHLAADGDLLDIDLGHLPTADVSVSLDYPTARAVLVDGDGESAMAAFMAGRLRVEGDMTKLLAFQSRPLSDAERELHAEIRNLTAP